jgi:hypothetical protein
VRFDDEATSARHQAWSEFDAAVATFIHSEERARLVRRWRVEELCSFPTIATRAHMEWHGDWQPPSNQLAGVALCAAAARMLGEDPGEEPWS